MRGRMSQDQFLLKWNNHQNNFVEVFNYLRTQEAFVDVTLACDGRSFSAHKVVLSACSPYFQTLFTSNPCKHPIVFLKDVKGQDLEALIEFIYKGEVSVSQTELGSLISTAENLKIKGLAEPERPLDKAKRLSSPPRSVSLQAQTVTCSPQAQLQSALQHTPLTLFQSSGSPTAKRKRCDYTFTPLRDKDDKIPSATNLTTNACISTTSVNDGHLLSISNRDLQLREPPLREILTTTRDQHSREVVRDPHHRDPSPQVLLVSQDAGPVLSDAYVTHPSSQPYVSTSNGNSSEGVLYSVAAGAIYVGSREVRDPYPPSDPYPESEETPPGPSGMSTNLNHDEDSSMNIKLEPTVLAPDGWDGSNQSYDDECGRGSDGGVVTPNQSSSGVTLNSPLGSPSDLSLALPLHTEITENSQLQENSRIAAAHALLCALGATSNRLKSTKVNEGINNAGFSTPGRCKICGRTIPRGEHRSHMASHTGHRPLHCAVCGRGFHQTEDLKRHIRIHTGEKPYKCMTCGIAFRQRGHLSRHVFKYHPGQEVHLGRLNR